MRYDTFTWTLVTLKPQQLLPYPREFNAGNTFGLHNIDPFVDGKGWKDERMA